MEKSVRSVGSSLVAAAIAAADAMAARPPRRRRTAAGPRLGFRRFHEAATAAPWVHLVQFPGGFHVEPSASGYRPAVGDPVRLTYLYEPRRLTATRCPEPGTPEGPVRVSLGAGIEFIASLGQAVRHSPGSEGAESCCCTTDALAQRTATYGPWTGVPSDTGRKSG